MAREECAVNQMARMTSHGQPVEALAHAGKTVLRTESVKSVDCRTETNCGSKTLNQRQQHIDAAAGEDDGKRLPADWSCTQLL